MVPKQPGARKRFGTIYLLEQIRRQTVLVPIERDQMRDQVPKISCRKITW